MNQVKQGFFLLSELYVGFEISLELFEICILSDLDYISVRKGKLLVYDL